MESVRTFIAIELPSEVRARVIEHIDRLRRELPHVRASWIRQGNLHLTLKFLGNVEINLVPKVSDAVARSTKNGTSLELTISGSGSFPTHGRPSVLWLGAQASGLQTLHEAIDRELVSIGLPGEARAFHPHLTIARLRTSEGARALADLHRSLPFAPLSFTVSEVLVFRSELLREGSKHTVISRHKLT